MLENLPLKVIGFYTFKEYTGNFNGLIYNIYSTLAQFAFYICVSCV